MQPNEVSSILLEVLINITCPPKSRTAQIRCGMKLKRGPDVSFGFEDHFIRGLAKMRLRIGLSLLVMLAMALGRIREKQKPHLRSLVKVA